MGITIEGKEYLTYKEVAKVLRYRDSTIPVMVSRGTFEATKFKGDAKKYIDIEQVKKHQNNESEKIIVMPHGIVEKERSTQEVPFPINQSVEMYRAETERMLKMRALDELKALLMPTQTVTV